MKKSIRIAGVGLVMAVVCGGVYLNGLMPIITGYAAKNLASAVFVSGREARRRTLYAVVTDKALDGAAEDGA